MKKFKRVYIEIGNICNLSCEFCPITQRRQEFMDLGIFTKILDQIKPYTDYIYFHVKGEPLLHPKLDSLLDISYAKGFKVNITTNGTLISKTADKLINKPALRQINFSLHSFDGDYNSTDYFNNIFKFIEASKQTPLLVSLRLWNLDQDNKVNLKKERNRQMLSMIEKEFDLDYKIEEKVLPGKGIKIAEKIYLNQDHRFKWPDLKEDEDNGVGFCYGLRDQVAILVNGTVVPCCLDGEGIINLGNIKNETFTNIIEGKRAKDIYDGFSNRQAVEELCRKCGYRKKFGR